MISYQSRLSRIVTVYNIIYSVSSMYTNNSNNNNNNLKRLNAILGIVYDILQNCRSSLEVFQPFDMPIRGVYITRQLIVVYNIYYCILYSAVVDLRGHTTITSVSRALPLFHSLSLSSARKICVVNTVSRPQSH